LGRELSFIHQDLGRHLHRRQTNRSRIYLESTISHMVKLVNCESSFWLDAKYQKVCQ
jgi:hypothetical protein